MLVVQLPFVKATLTEDLVLVFLGKLGLFEFNDIAHFFRPSSFTIYTMRTTYGVF